MLLYFLKCSCYLRRFLSFLETCKTLPEATLKIAKQKEIKWAPGWVNGMSSGTFLGQQFDVLHVLFYLFIHSVHLNLGCTLYQLLWRRIRWIWRWIRQSLFPLGFIFHKSRDDGLACSRRAISATEEEPLPLPFSHTTLTNGSGPHFSVVRAVSHKAVSKTQHLVDARIKYTHLSDCHYLI